ncbi:MAG: hypothetical protein Q4C13_02405 [Clostridia bacterium]|nr:hypothetical protein [Clostridia bacterium]
MIAVSAVVRQIFLSNRLSFILTAILMLCATTSGDSAMALSNGNYTWLLALMTPFFVVYYDYTRFMCLGTSKKDYYIGSLAGYGLLSVCISLVNTGVRLLIDPLNKTQTVINMMDLCGWTENGMAAAFFQQALFLLLVMIFLHVLLSMQPYWYGWLTDGVLAAIICVFTPLAPLRRILAGFFKIVMFNSHALMHVGICLLLCGALSFAGLAVLKRKTL